MPVLTTIPQEAQRYRALGVTSERLPRFVRDLDLLRHNERVAENRQTIYMVQAAAGGKPVAMTLDITTKWRPG